MGCPTTEMRVPITLTFAGNDTQTSNWIYVHGYDKMSVSGYWTGSITQTAGVIIQGTDQPPEHGGTFQPSPSAVEIDDIVTLTNIAPAGTASTAGARDEYSNVLPMFVRVKMTETATEAGTLVLVFVFKSSS